MGKCWWVGGLGGVWACKEVWLFSLLSHSFAFSLLVFFPHRYTPAGEASKDMFEKMLVHVPEEMRASTPAFDQPFQTFSDAYMKVGR